MSYFYWIVPAVVTLVAVASGGSKKGTTMIPLKMEKLTRVQARDFFERAFVDVFGREPEVQEEAMLLAQSAHETARWTRMPGWNWGGLKGKGNLGSMSALTKEGPGEGKSVVDGFRAYTDALAGCVDWLSLLKRRYGAALAGASAGDVRAFVSGLRSRGYFTGDVEPYVNSVRSMGREWIVELGGDVDPAKPKYFAMSGWRRAKLSELSQTHKDLAKFFLTQLSLGEHKIHGGVLYAAETHSNAAKGISVFFPDSVA